MLAYFYRYGDGYTVILRISGIMPDLEPVKDFMNTTFVDCVLKVCSYLFMLLYIVFFVIIFS